MKFIKDHMFTAIILVILIGGLSAIGWVTATEKTQVDGTSMAPTLDDGQSITLNVFSYKFEDVNYGDIVVIKPEGNPQYVKRVVGLPGDNFKYKNNTLYRNDKPLTQFHTKEALSKIGVPENAGQWDVELKKGQYYVLSDNLDGTTDSRKLGYITDGEILGKVIKY